MKKTILCQMCGKKETYEAVHHFTNPRKFCVKCADVRKRKCIDYSNTKKFFQPDRGLKLKQQKSQEPVFISWDEPNILGY
jgi:transcription initiation factor TFIIIB Brf1 subunit/transcription initiation factor TFIIB